MRKGSKRNDWTVAEEQFLIVNAGKIPKRDICQMLKRSSKSVERKAAWLRNKGCHVDLHYHRPTLEPCPWCGKPSATIDRTGRCEPCRRRDQLAAINARIAELWPHLTPEQQRKYEEEEAKIESTKDPLPEAPSLEGLPLHRRDRLEENHARSVEAVVAKNLRREVKARQKRKERIQKKINLNQWGSEHDPR